LASAGLSYTLSHIRPLSLTLAMDIAMDIASVRLSGLCGLNYAK